MIDEILTLYGSFVFPIAMCIYLTLKFEKTINKNTEAINNLSSVIQKK